MDSNRHTQGKWSYSFVNVYGGTNSHEQLIAICGNEKVDRANARRIAVCVTRLSDFCTEDIENPDIDLFGVSQATTRANIAEANLKALVAAIQGVLDLPVQSSGHSVTPPTREYRMQEMRAYRALHEAMAKVKS